MAIMTVGGKVAAKELLDQAQKIIKTGKTKKRETLVDKKKVKQIQIEEAKSKIKETETDLVANEAQIKVDQKDIKLKNKPEVNVDQADDFLFNLKNSKVPPKVLKDFNINNISTRGDMLKLIEETSKSFKGSITKQKRGVMTFEDTRGLADLLQTNSKKLYKVLLDLSPGDTLNAEYLLAAREVLGAGMAQLDDLAKKAATGNEKDLLKFRQHFALMGEFQKTLIGVKTETARALSSMRIQTQKTGGFKNIDIDDLNRSNLLLELGGEENIRGVAKLYISKAMDGKAKFDVVKKVGTLTKFSDATAEVFINVILSNPVTHIRNTAGNWLSMSINNFERKMASRFYGGKEKGGVAAYEDVAKIYGKQQASTEMLAALSKVWNEEGTLKFAQKFDERIPANFGGTSKVEVRANRFDAFDIENSAGASATHMLGRILTMDRVPTRFLSVMDNYFKNMEYRSELYALAYRETIEAVNTGIVKQADAADYLADLVVNPTKSFTQKAYDAAHYVTYQTKLNNRHDRLGSIHHIQKLKNNSGPFSFLSNYYLPFIQTPTNILGFVSERTPGLAQVLTRYNADIAEGGAKAQMARTRLALGSMFYMATMPLGYYGVTGGSDIDIPNNMRGSKSIMMKAIGYQPNSIRFPDPRQEGKYVQVNTTGLDPFNMMLSTSANTGKILGMVMDNHDQAQDILSHLLAFTLAIGEQMSDSTYLAGISKGMNDIQTFKAVGAVEGAYRWGSKFSASFVPGVVKQVGKAFNDDFNKINTEFNEYMLKNVNESNLEYDYSILGDRIEKFGHLSSFEMTPVKEELLNVLPTFTSIDKKISYNFGPGMNVSIPLTSEELRFYKKNSGQLFKQGMEELIENENYINETNAIVKEAMIKDTLSQARGMAKEFLLNEDNPFLEDIRVRGEDLRNKKIITRQRGEPLTAETEEALGMQ
jgi:hypothetical protein